MMRLLCVFAPAAMLMMASACGTGDGHESRAASAQSRPALMQAEPRLTVPAELSPWPKDWSSYLGREVRISGTAADAKLGAILLGEDNQSIWMDGIDAWPSGYYQGGDQGKRVCIIGTVIEKKDLPVFVQKKGEPMMQGMPVPEGTDLEQAKRRYLIAKPVFCP